MRRSLHAAAMAAVFLAATQPAQAQGFLKKLADRAAGKVQQEAERAAENLAQGGDPAPSSRGGTRTQAEQPPAVMTPRSVRGSEPREAASPAAAAPATPEAAATPVTYVSDLPLPAGIEAVKQAFEDFGKVLCSSCEGGYSYDSWPTFPHDEFSGTANATVKRIGAMPVGHVHRWKGVQSEGTLMVAAEETISGLRCRRLQYKLVKGNQSAERPGLVCWGYPSSLAGIESWNAVY